MKRTAFLLHPSYMTRSERVVGRLLRAPEGHQEGAPPAAPEGSGGLENLPGGVQRYTPPVQETGAEAPKEQAAPGLPEGYSSWEQYGQDVLSGKVTPPAPAKQEEAPQGQQEAPQISPELAAKFEPFNAEFTETGTLSDESVAKAAADFGVTEDMVRQYLAGASNTTSATTAQFHSQTGGAEGYAEFQAWSVDGMTKAEQDSLNAAYKGGNVEAALALQQKFVDRWTAEGNGPPARDLTRNSPNNGPAEDVKGYASLAEQKRDQADPRYATDEAFRQRVYAKIANSKF